MLKSKLGLLLVLFHGSFLGIAQAQAPNPFGPKANPLTWSPDLPAALKQAKLENKMVFVDISPDWSSASQRMEAEIAADSRIQKQLAAFIRVKINPTYLGAQEIADQLSASPICPIFCILDDRGAVAMTGGFKDTDKFQQFLTDFQKRFFDDPLAPFEVKWNVSWSKNQTYSFNVPKPEIANSPVWPENEKSPPLAPRKAIRIAQAKLQEIAKDGWRFDSIKLTRIDAKGHWTYRVIFSENPPPDGGVIVWSSGNWSSVPVLMNGYVPPAELSHVDERKQ